MDFKNVLVQNIRGGNPLNPYAQAHKDIYMAQNNPDVPQFKNAGLTEQQLQKNTSLSPLAQAILNNKSVTAKPGVNFAAATEMFNSGSQNPYSGSAGALGRILAGFTSGMQTVEDNKAATAKAKSEAAEKLLMQMLMKQAYETGDVAELASVNPELAKVLANNIAAAAKDKAHNEWQSNENALQRDLDLYRTDEQSRIADARLAHDKDKENEIIGGLPAKQWYEIYSKAPLWLKNMLAADPTAWRYIDKGQGYSFNIAGTDFSIGDGGIAFRKPADAANKYNW